jgi:hypothetical protein
MPSEDTLDDPGAWDHVTAYDASEQRPSEAILAAVAGATGRDMFAGQPLYEAIDPDALDSMVQAGRGNEVSVSFSYLGCYVRADYETVRVRRFDGTGME